MWIYWKEQCNYCSNYENCSYYNKVQELISRLDSIDRYTTGVYGTLKWACDYFKVDENKYYRLNSGECYNGINS